MKLLKNMDEVTRLIEWQQAGENRELKLKFQKGSEDYIVEVADLDSNETQTVTAVSEITISNKKTSRVRKRDTNKILRKLNGSFYPFVRWMERGNREFHFIIKNGEDDEVVSIFVYDRDLEVGQTVWFLEQIDLLSEKVLILMNLAGAEKDETIRQGYIKEIVELERRKLLPQR